MNTWIHCHDSYHYQSLIGDSELFLELLESLSELKLVLEVVELIVDLDSEVLQSKFGILIAKSAIFWTQFWSYTVHNQHLEWKTIFNMCFNGEFYFFE